MPTLIKTVTTIEVETKELPDALYQEALRIGLEAMLEAGRLKIEDGYVKPIE